MTRLLTKAFREAKRLPKQVQDELAEILLSDIIGENNWDKTLEKSSNKLAKLGKKALEEFKAGKTEEVGFDKL